MKELAEEVWFVVTDAHGRESRVLAAAYEITIALNGIRTLTTWKRNGAHAGEYTNYSSFVVTGAPQVTAESAMAKPIIEYFKYDHLPAVLQAVSKPICEAALQMDKEIPDDPEKTVGLRKLLEAKDCFVRASME